MTELVTKVLIRADASGLIGQVKEARDALGQLRQATAGTDTSLAATGRAGAAAAAGIAQTGQAAAAAAAPVVNLGVVEQRLGDILRATIQASEANIAALSRLTVANDTVSTSAKKAGASEDDLARRLRTLLGTIDPVYAAQERLNSALAEADALHKAGALTATRHAEVQRQITARFSEGAVSAGQHRAALTNLSRQFQDVTTSLSLGMPFFTVASAQLGQIGDAANQLGAKGALGRLASFMAGPLGAVTIAAVGLLGNLAVSFLSNSDAAEKAADALDKFKSRQSDIGNFIDRTTGKLIEQNKVLIRNAVLSRQATIEENKKKIDAGSTAAFTAVRSRVINDEGGGYQELRGGAPGVTVDRDLRAVVRAAGTDVAKLDEGLAALARRRPELRALIQQVSEAAGEAILLARENKRLGAEVDQLNGKTANQTRTTASLVEKQVALATATTPLERARARLALIQERGNAAEKAGGVALDAYRRDLTVASQAVKAAEAAEKKAAEGRRESAKATREAARDTREYLSTLKGLEGAFDPAASAARRYADALADIAAAKLDPATAKAYSRAAGGRFVDELAQAEAERRQKAIVGTVFDPAGLPSFVDLLYPPDAAAKLEGQLTRSLELSANGFGGELTKGATTAAQAFGNLLKSASQGGGLSGALTGRLSLGSLANLRSASGEAYETAKRAYAANGTPIPVSFAKNEFEEGLASVFAPLRDGFKDLLRGLDKNLGANGELGKTLGAAFGGAVAGKQVIGLAKGAGIKGLSSTGGELGGALGGGLASLSTVATALGPIGAAFAPIAGALLGGVVGGLLKKTKFGSVSLTSATGDTTATGNDGAAKAAATGLAGSIQSGLQSIADQLGGRLGSFNVTVGQRHGDYRVTTGTSLKVKAGAKDFDDDEGAAAAYAIRLAIEQGAVTGLSAAVQRALNSSSDINKSLQEALRVDKVEEILGGLGATLQKSFRSFETNARERVRIAREYGFDVVAIEQRNADERKKLIEDTVASRVGGLSDLLTSLRSGDLFEGTGADRRSALLGRIEATRADARAGKDGAAASLADMLRDLTSLSKDTFGTAGTEYAADRGLAEAAADEIIQLENQRVREAAAAAARTNELLARQTGLANENNNQNAEILASLGGIGASIARLVAAQGGGAPTNLSLTTIQARL